MQNQQPTWQALPTAGLQVNSVALSPDGAMAIAGTSSEFGTGQFNLYAYNASGAAIWQQSVTPADSTQGVFWVAINDTKLFAAAGGETAKNCGFLTVCDASNGRVIHQETLASRVNQLSFSADGSLLLVVLEQQLRLYQYANQEFNLTSTADIPANNSCMSALIANDGSRVWASAINYNTTPYSGLVQTFTVQSGMLGTAQSYSMASGVMRIAVTADGAYAAAAIHDGSCALFQSSRTTSAVWQFNPGLANLSLAYAVAITQTSAGKLVVACGANQTGAGGYLYLVDSTPNLDEIAGAPAWIPSLRWHSSLAYATNPGVNLDTEATKVTATDGKPNEQSNTTESPGNFYLFDAVSGAQLWQYGTQLMNWPMVITPDGAQCLGGSDDGSIYYWQLSA